MKKRRLFCDMMLFDISRHDLKWLLLYSLTFDVWSAKRREIMHTYSKGRETFLFCRYGCHNARLSFDIARAPLSSHAHKRAYTTVIKWIPKICGLMWLPARFVIVDNISSHITFFVRIYFWFVSNSNKFTFFLKKGIWALLRWFIIYLECSTISMIFRNM